MKNFKKVLSSVLLVCMLVSVCAVGAYAAPVDPPPVTGQTGGPEQPVFAGTPGAPGAPTEPGGPGEPEGGNTPDNGAPQDTNGGTDAQNAPVNNTVYFVDADGNSITSIPAIKVGETLTLTAYFNTDYAGYTVSFSLDSGNDGSVISVGEPATSDETGYKKVAVNIVGKGIGSDGLTCVITDTSAAPIDAAADGADAQAVKSFQSSSLPISVESGIILVSGKGTAAEEISGQMYSGSTLQLTADVTSDGFKGSSITYSSDDEKVATVNANGLVTAVAEGSTTIKATVTNAAGATQTASYSLTVVPALVPVTGVKINQATASVKLNENVQLTAAVEPANATNQNVTWASDNTSVARVDSNGLVTGVANGTAKITVTTADGGYTASCDVTVTSDPIYVTGIQIKDGDVDVTSQTLEMAHNTSKDLTAVVEPENADNKAYTWSSSAEKVATVDKNGRVSAKDVGTATITVTSAENNNITASVTVNVTGEISVSGNTSIVKGQETQLTASLKPENNVTVSWTSSDANVASVDANGKVKAVGVGKATITASAANYKDGTIEITVVDVGTPMIELTVGPSETITQRGGLVNIIARYGKLTDKGFEPDTSGITVSFSVQPEGQANGYEFTDYRNNKAVFRGNLNGNYKITARYGNASAEKTIKVSYAPAIVSGNNSVFDGKNELRFVVNDSIYNFNDCVWVDGFQLTKGTHFYSVSTSDGQIGIALNPAYLNYINRSAYHTITIGNSYGNASGYFRTWGVSSSIDGVKTGDDSNLALWLLLCLGSAACATAAVVGAKKKKN